MTESQLARITGGNNAAMTWGAQAASDGLAAMDSSNPIKAGAGMILAAAGGWSYLGGMIWDLL